LQYLLQDDDREFIEDGDGLSVVSSEWSEVSRADRPHHFTKGPDEVRRAVPANVMPQQSGPRPSMIPRRPKSLTSSIHTVQVGFS
jgi:hypothetical protein